MVFSSWISIIVYFMFLLLFLLIELLVVIIKFTSTQTDYEYKVLVGDTIKKEQVLRSLDADMRDKINKEIEKK